jgi:hypothetical protein
MNILHVILESNTKITRLNCSNCVSIKDQECKPLKRADQNDQGGTLCTTASQKAVAKKVRLITLPGAKPVSSQCWCNHPDVEAWVTERMWCTRWEAPGVVRSFEEPK